jgi:adenosylmethionine-8-amino-7-oxononanoate aminotransferase
LRKAANEYLFIGMNSRAQLKAEGGPLVPTSSRGIYISDIDGREYIDGISGMYFRNIGHGREEVAKAVYDQLTKVSMNVYASATPPTIQLATKLAQIMPGDLSRTFFSLGGSDANETSLKMAQSYHVRNGEPSRYKVISRRGSYHGTTYGTMWLGGHPGFARSEYQPVPQNVVHVPQPHFYRCELGSRSPAECAERTANAVEEAILFHGPDSVSAFLGEPVSHPYGGVVPPNGYWQRIREICDRYGVLLVFDEVITGFGRLGTWFGADYVGVTPDIMSFAKGITSGYFPVGGSIATPKVADVFNETAFSHMYTYTAHPAGSAAGLAALEIVERENLVDNARVRGEQLERRLLDMKEMHPIVGDVRGAGLLRGIEFVKDRKTKEHFDPALKVNTLLTKGFLGRGLWLRAQPYIIPIAPPLIVTADEVDQIADAIDGALTDAESELGIG